MNKLCIKIGLVALVVTALLGNGAPARANATSLRPGVSVALERVCKSPAAGLSARRMCSLDALSRLFSLVQSAGLAVHSAQRPYSFNWDVVAL